MRLPQWEETRIISYCHQLFSWHFVLEPAVTASEQVFEPVLNVPALGTFLFISIVFSLLQIRTSQVEAAVQERKKALAELRQIKSLELTEEYDTATVQQALEQFEQAVQTEERLRNIIPGVARIVPPNAANDPAEQEARAAAKQFLGKEYDVGMEQRSNNDNSNEDMASSKATSSPVAIIVLALVFLSQLALLIFLGQDPMSASVTNM